MQIIDRDRHVASNVLWRVLALIISLLLTTGCAATTKTILKNVETVEVCLNGKCGMASGRFTKNELIGGLLMMLKADENSEAVLCSSDDNSRKCKQEMLRWFVQGGPIPGHASFKKPYLIQVGLDKNTSQIKFKMDATTRWIGTPVFCQDAYTEVTVSSTDQILIESKFACTWTVFPHVWNIKYSVGFIDFDNSIIAGNYAVAGGGLLTVGGGSGAFIMRLARKNTLVAQAGGDTAREAVLVPVGQLSPHILAAPVPMREEVKESKGGIDPTERTMWESVSEKIRQMDTGNTFQATLKADLSVLPGPISKQLRREKLGTGNWLSGVKSRTAKIPMTSIYLAKYPEGRFTRVARERQKAAALARAMAKIDFGRYHALVIGNSDYHHLRDLATAINDAKAVGSLLEQAYGFNVTCLTNASRKQIIDALSRFRRTLTERDNLLIYFAGHGWLDKEAGRGYWLPVDSERDSPANWISTGDISDMLKAMVAKHVMVIADSCYSGTLTRSIKLNIPTSEYFRRMANKRTRVALSSGGLEPVLDDGSGGHSVFAKAFLEVLEKNKSVLEGTRLFNELRRPVILNAPQTPEYADILYAGHEGGDFLFVRK